MNEMDCRAYEEHLILDNMGLVVSLARSFKPANKTQLEDYIQSGRIGLWKAIQKHDPSKAKLSTVAWHYIRWEIIKNIPHSKKNIDKTAKSVCFSDLPYTPSQLIPSLFCRLNSSVLEFKPETLSAEENKVFDMRACGYTMKEIGNEFGKSRAWANTIFKKMAQKVKEANLYE
jgi:RNA polymerase sigma factor (sigma-70 family)